LSDGAWTERKGGLVDISEALSDTENNDDLAFCIFDLEGRAFV
jgi:hypothetical protein